jgi:hypothetical protein
LNDPLKILDPSGISGCTCKDEAQLTADGWERRYVADQRAAVEAETNYRQLGFEVKLVPLDPESLRDECSDCKAVIGDYRIVFTRRRVVP